MHKKIFIKILVLLILQTAMAQDEFPNRSLGIILFSYDDLSTAKIKGTGFVFMRENFVLSCEHVLAGAGDYKSIWYNPYTNKSEFIPLEVVYVDRGADIVIFKSREPITEDFLEPSSFDELKVGKEMRYYAYNIEDKEFRTASEIILTKGEIKNNDVHTDFINFQGDKVIGGYSGGPIFSEEGKLVGILSSIYYFSEAIDSQKFKIARGFTMQPIIDKINSGL